MFTVKVRAPDGTESLYSCETIDVIGGPKAMFSEIGNNTQGRDMYEEGIFLDRVLDGCAPGERPFYTSKHTIQFGGDETADRQARKGGKVWVMNEAGATVATYDL